MGLLTESALTALVAQGCECGSRALLFRAYLDGRVPLQAGEPVGQITWTYDGEKFVDGVYQCTCAACKRVLFSADLCPRCHAPGTLARSLAEPNTLPLLTECPACGVDEVRVVGFFPARVAHDGGRAEKARTQTELGDPGFHGVGFVCTDCGPVGPVSDACPLCDAPGPLRERPGD